VTVTELGVKPFESTVMGISVAGGLPVAGTMAEVTPVGAEVEVAVGGELHLSQCADAATRAKAASLAASLDVFMKEKRYRPRGRRAIAARFDEPAKSGHCFRMAGKRQNPWRSGSEAMILARAIACGTFCPCCIATVVVPASDANDGRQGVGS
jgi:hypothetical protein